MISAPGPLELLVILVVALLVLGPKRLPEAARSVRTRDARAEGIARRRQHCDEDDHEDERDHERERAERAA